MIEYKVRQVCRYVVTRFEQTGNSGSCGSVGEFPNIQSAKIVADAMAKSDGGTVVSNILPDHDVAAMLHNIATEIQGMTVPSGTCGIRRGIVVLESQDGSTEVYGLGAEIGDAGELFDKGRERYQTLLQDE